MARCIRNGVSYKRHRFKKAKCEACGDAQKPKSEKAITRKAAA